MDRDTYREERFFDASGIEGRLRCYGRHSCTFDVWLPTHGSAAAPPPAHLEVLWQPRDSETGLPRGVPLRLLREPLRFVELPGQRCAIARSRLPGVRPGLAPECYYRIVHEASNAD